MLVLAGAADTTTVIFRGSVVQTTTPDRFRGRVTAVDRAVGAGLPRLGNFEAGAVASLTSPAVSAVSGGLAAMAGVAVIRLAFPAVARHGALAGRRAGREVVAGWDSSLNEGPRKNLSGCPMTALPSW
jgi:hypothetical protein